MTVAQAARLRLADWRVLLAAAVFACLPTVGTFGGGSYAAFVIGLTVILLLGEIAERRRPAMDWPLASLAAAFLALIWLGLAWSVAPARTLGGDLQMTGLFVAGLVAIGSRGSIADGSETILRAALVAAVAGPLLLILDLAVGHPIMTLAYGAKSSDQVYFAKLPRGLAQLAVLIWPILAFGWLNGHRRLTGAAAAIFAALLLWQISYNMSVTLSFAVGLVVFALAWRAPRLVAGALAAVTTIVAIGSPFVIQAVGRPLMPIADQIKASARHRLEIWDYITARALERPFSGWGWQTAQFLPVTPEEKAHYKYFWATGIPHPHDFWIQLWAETGVFGLLLGLAFALIVLGRIWRQPQDVRPFGLAAFATAFAVSLPSFNLSTDSWWCALAATGLLFLLLPSARQRLTQ
jgi:O-antigen ligase